MISKPLSSGHMTEPKSLLIIIFIWLYSSFVTVPPLLGWGGFDIEGPGISCSVDWETRSWWNTTYILYMFAFGLFLPLLVMGFSYINIIRSLKQSRMRGMQSSVSKAEGRVAVMIFVMAITFLFAWTPYAVFALIMGFGDPSFVTPEASVAPAIFAKSSCIYNPIIYVGLNTQFRTAWKELLCGITEKFPKNNTIQQSLTIGSEDESTFKVSPSPKRFTRRDMNRTCLNEKTLSKMLSVRLENDFTSVMCTTSGIELQPIRTDV